MIVHMTTVHPRDDSRILHKEAAALAAAEGANGVRLYVQDGLGDGVDARSGVRIVDTGPRERRLARMTRGAWRMIRAVRHARPRVVFFHDPELLPWALILRLSGIATVYDAHEDMPRTILHNTRLPRWLRPVLAPVAEVIEHACVAGTTAVMGATETIVNRFPSHKSFLLRNFPILEEMAVPARTPMSDRAREFTYIGTITENRNIEGMIDAVARVSEPDIRLRLAGEFTQPGLEEQMRSHPGWSRVDFEGWVGRDEVAEILASSRGGLVLLRPIPHAMEALPIKLFEYMAAGLPVLSSDFPLWRKIVESAGCGILIDPDDWGAIAAAMARIVEDPLQAEEMGRRGRQAVIETYSWEKESERLLEVHRFADARAKTMR